MSDIRRSATQTLMTAMEDFGENEPKDCIVIHTNEAGDICWSCTSDSYVIKLGLVEACSTYMKIKMGQE